MLLVIFYPTVQRSGAKWMFSSASVYLSVCLFC